jgi:eukaryotic-like serine/threonine-protein kinase
MTSRSVDVTLPSPAASRVLPPVEVTGISGDGAKPLEAQLPTDASYEVLGKLGEGAMGEVKLARDPVLRRAVALKSILPQATRDGSLLQRFVGEMQITAQLDHPHIVPVYGVERSPGALAYAMKLVQGKELEHLLEETRALVAAGQPLDAEHSLQTRLEIFLKVCDAVAYAHSRGVVHRDLKPSNVMIGSFNEVYVMDWGIARQIGLPGATQDHSAASVKEDTSAQLSTRTRVGDTVGTPSYMSPEQAAGKNDELDGRSDQYALGLMLHEVVTLEGAMDGASVQMVLVNALQGKRNAMRSAKVDVPRELVAIVDRACKLRPEERYASVAELAAEVRRYTNNEAILALPDSLPRKLGRWVSNHRMLAIGLLVGTFVLGLVGAGAVWAVNQIELAEKRNREVRLVEVQADSSSRAQRLDEALIEHEQALQRLAGAAGIVLGRGDGAELEPMTEDRFRVEDAASGLVQSVFYGKPISFDAMVAARAASSDARDLAVSYGALQSLDPALQRTMVDSLDDDSRKLGLAAQREVLAKTGAPVTRIGFALENGLTTSYPGMAGLPAATDGRADPLVQQAKLEGGVVWGPPSATSDGKMLLSCATTIQAPDGRLLGVVRLEVDVGRSVTSALSGGRDAISTSLLVDRTGKVLAQSSTDPSQKEPDELANAEVRAAIERGEAGYVATKRNGRDVVVTYQPLTSMDWYLVTVADVNKLEEVKEPAGTRPGSVPAPSAAAQRKSRGPVPAPTSPAPQPPRLGPTSAATASASAAPSVAPSVAPARTGRLPKAPPNPFEPWPVYQPKQPK